MSKAQGWILTALILAAVIDIFANAQAKVLLKQGHPIQAADVVNPKLMLYWVGAVIVLVLLADASPMIAGWIAGLILLGAVLVKGPQALGVQK